VRDSIGEAIAAHWSDDKIMQRINSAQSSIARMMANNAGQWLTTRAMVTPVAGVITLPVDCGRPLYLEEVDSGRRIGWISSVAARWVSRQSGVSLDAGIREAYALRNTIEVNDASYATSCYLWYEKRLPDMAAGTASAGGVSSLTLPNERQIKRTDDYYNDLVIEVISGTGAGSTTITDFVGSTRVCTLTGTYDATSVFGTVSLLPEEARRLLEVMATLSCLSRPGSVLDEKVYGYYEYERKREEKSFQDWLASRVPGQGKVEVLEPL
jgi:hypothetical protein